MIALFRKSNALKITKIYEFETECSNCFSSSKIRRVYLKVEFINKMRFRVRGFIPKNAVLGPENDFLAEQMVCLT